ncbi:MAG TPA: XdhC family protein [Gemmataceae bacterium]|jgi:xanthine dehydrogenase accessory factor
MRDLLTELERVIDRGLACACCTVVATRGSTPQKAGASMLVYPDGTQAGTLGGGCVEAEVRRRALHALAAAGGPALHTFTLDDDFGWDDGLICGGRMTILAAPLSPAAADYYRRLRQLIDAGDGCTELVALPENRAGLPAGARYLFDAAGQPAAALDGPPAADLARLLPPTDPRPRPAVADGMAVLPVPPRVTLLIVGGGHVGQAVAKLAAECDFDVWVLDDRDAFANAGRFPRAERLIVGDIGRTLRDLVAEVTPHTYALIVTRGHNHDEEALYHLAATPAGYVGMIGSKRKVKLIFDDLRAKGVSEEALARVRAPVGLEIGSQTVAEIAVSIVAELVARRNTGNPG